MSEVSASSCKLSWQASRNTGGLPLDYLVERLAVSDGTWVKAAATTSTHITINDLGNDLIILYFLKFLNFPSPI